MTAEGATTVPQAQKLDRDTIRRWRSEAITYPATERLWLNRCEALCNALLDARAERDDFEQRLHACIEGERGFGI